MSSSIFRNIFSNWLGLAAAALVGLAISPFVIHSLGKESYGLLVIAVSIASQFAIFDLGVRNAVVKYTAQYRASSDTLALNRLVSSSLGFNCVTSIPIIAISIAILPFFGPWFDVDPSVLRIGIVVLLVLAADAIVEHILGLYQGVLAGCERYDLINMSNVFRLLFNAVCVVAVLKSGFGIIGVAFAAFFSRLVYRLAVLFLAKQQVPSLRVSPRSFDNKTVGRVVGYGLWACVIVVASRLIYQFDLLVVGTFEGAAAVSIYAVAVILVDQFRLLAEGTSTVLTPRFSSLIAVGEIDVIERLVEKWASYGELLSLSICIPLLVTGADFIRLWMGVSFADSVPILWVLTIPFLLSFPPMALASLLYARSEHKLNAVIVGAEAICNVGLSIVLARYFGLLGVALGTLGPSVVSRGIVLPLLATKRTGLSMRSYVYHAYIKCVPAAIVLCGALVGLKALIGAESWFQFVSVNALGLIVYAASVCLFYVADEDWLYIKRRVMGPRR